MSCATIVVRLNTRKYTLDEVLETEGELLEMDLRTDTVWVGHYRTHFVWDPFPGTKPSPRVFPGI